MSLCNRPAGNSASASLALRASGVLGGSNARSCSSAASAKPKADMAKIKELRERSGAPVKDVKAALEVGGWDMDQAFAELRKKGLAAAAKKGGRAAEEGLVGIAAGPHAVSLVEINCETDFVARNEKFQSLVGAVAESALSAPHADAAAGASSQFRLSEETLAGLKVGPSGIPLSEAVAEVGGTVRENVQFCRAFRIQQSASTGGVISTYLHTSPAPGLGRIGAIVAIEASSPSDLGAPEVRKTIEDIGKKIAMHVVAAKPQFLDRRSVTAEALEAEKKLLTEQAAASGKPPAIVEKMVMGRMNKYYEEFCLAEQKFVMDDSMTVSKVLQAVGKDLGLKEPLKLTGYIRAEVGETSPSPSQDDGAE